MDNDRDEKLYRWHKHFVIFPRKTVAGNWCWGECWRKGYLKDGSGDHAMATVTSHCYHTNEEHFTWLMEDGVDEIIDNTWWTRFSKIRPKAPPPPPKPKKTP